MKKPSPLSALIKYRHEIFLLTCFVVLIATALEPVKDGVSLSYVFFVSNLVAAGTLFIGNRRWSLIAIVTAVVFGFAFTLPLRAMEPPEIQLVRPVLFAAFYGFVTVQITLDVWLKRLTTSQTLAGLMSGYIALGVCGFFVFLVIWAAEPNAFSNVAAPETATLFYFSFVTILSLGYGDIAPLTEVARCATMIIALLGQFYLVIVMAVALNRFEETRKARSASSDAG